jgi:hypothetical protein
MLSILISFSMLANNESEIDEASVKHPKIVVSNTGDFPNPILKLWNFFFKDYKSFGSKCEKIKIRHNRLFKGALLF